MSRRGLTFSEMAIAVAVFCFFAALGLAKLQQYDMRLRQADCISNQKTIDQAFSVWETKNTPIPPTDGVYQFLNPKNGAPLIGPAASHRWQWEESTGRFQSHGAAAPETRAILPNGTQISQLIGDDEVFCCPELEKRAGGVDFIRVIEVATHGNQLSCNTSQKRGNDQANVIYQFYKSPASSTPRELWESNDVTAGADHNITGNSVPTRIRRSVICHAYGMENNGVIGIPYSMTSTAVPAETLTFFNGAGPDGTRDMMHQSWLAP